MDPSAIKTPLLSVSDENSDAPPKLENRHIPSLDSAIETCIGGFNWSHFLQALLVSFAWFFDAQQTFITVFTDATPTWHLLAAGDTSPTICHLPEDTWTWDNPTESSTVSEFRTQCSDPIISGLPASAFFLGCFLGGIAFATLADTSLGRKKTLFLSCLAMAFSTLLTAFFATNVWTYSLLRFLAGAARATVGTCAIVLATELVGKRWRGEVGVFGFVFFTLGFLSLPAMAYANRGATWRNLYVWTSIPAVAYCVAVHFLVSESPRWLFVQGRAEEAMAILNESRSLTSNLLSVHFEEQTWNVDVYSTIKVLVEKRWALRRLASVMAIGVGVGLVYYGMPLALGNLKFNLYLSVTLNALSEFPSSLITFFLVSKLDRKASMLWFTTLSGVCGVMSVVKLGTEPLAGYLQIGLEVVSFFAATTAFDLLLIFAIELFPTCVRNSAVAMVRQAIVLGGVFGAPLARAGGVVAYVVFGVVIGCCGVFVVWLPETRGRGISDTMDEEESKMQKQVLCCC